MIDSIMLYIYVMMFVFSIGYFIIITIDNRIGRKRQKEKRFTKGGYKE